jgi:hypothetical protein
MHDSHRKAAEYHDLAAHAHRTASEHNEKGDHESGAEHSRRALEYSNKAYLHAQEAHNKSGRVETLP